MKNKHFLWLLVTAVFAVVGLNFKTAKVETLNSEKAISETLITQNDEAGQLYFAPSGMFYEYTWRLDTISNANNDTLYLPSNLRPLVSDFTVAVAITRTNISGTTNLAVKLEGTNWAYSGSTPPTQGWATALNTANAAAATAATTATTEHILLPSTWGLINYRVIVDGTGTQSSSYRIRLTLKKKT